MVRPINLDYEFVTICIYDRTQRLFGEQRAGPQWAGLEPAPTEPNRKSFNTDGFGCRPYENHIDPKIREFKMTEMGQRI